MSESEMDRAQALSDAWNELAQVALGRGTSPNVSDPLAIRVANERDAYREWLDSPLSIVQPLQPWRDRFAAVRGEVQDELGQEAVPDVPEGLLEYAADEASDMAADAAGAVAQGALWVVVGLGLLWVASRGSSR